MSRSQSQSEPEEQFVYTCPYDPAHKVKWSRFQYHLVKCAVGKPPLGICDYNACHRMPKEELEAHMRQCPDKPSKNWSQKTRGNIKKDIHLKLDIMRPDEYWD